MAFSALQRSNPLLAINHYTLFGEARHRLEKLRVIVDQSMMATPEVLAARMKDPVTFPCGHPSINHMRRGIECTCTGCIVPRRAPTPDGEDTPKWTAQQAQLEDDDERIGQPNISDVEKTPTKSKLPEGYDPTTGHTPLGAGGADLLNVRVKRAMAGCSNSQPHAVLRCFLTDFRSISHLAAATAQAFRATHPRRANRRAHGLLTPRPAAIPKANRLSARHS